MTAEVQIDGVTHRFGNFAALTDINLTIGAGRFAVLLGPSGCGKTTLLSVLGGFLQPDRGRVLIGGRDVTDIPPARRPSTPLQSPSEPATGTSRGQAPVRARRRAADSSAVRPGAAATIGPCSVTQPNRSTI